MIVESGCGDSTGLLELKSYRAVVNAYLKRCLKRHLRERKQFEEATDYDTALKDAALCLMRNGKRHPHQRRIPGRVLKSAHQLLKQHDLESCESFAELHSEIEQAIGPVQGIGELAIYDISERIGAYLGLRPEKVYLHAGVRVGARALGLGRGRDEIELEEFPKPFHKLDAAQIEDCLCIYKDELAQIAQGK